MNDVAGYILNGRVIFDPVNGILRQSGPDAASRDIVLNVPTARCLHLLLINDGLTSTSDLYRFAWPDSHEKTTPGNLYQNMSLLRKALATAFEDESEYVFNVPRKGFYLNPVITVRVASVEEVLPVEKTTENQPEKSPKKEKACCKTLRNCIGSHRVFFCVLTLAVMIFCLGYQALFANIAADKHFENYQEFIAWEYCRFYFSPVFEESEYPVLTERNHWVCDEGKYNFISNNTYSSILYVFSCDADIRKVSRAHCKSISILNAKHYNEKYKA